MFYNSENLNSNICFSFKLFLKSKDAGNFNKQKKTGGQTDKVSLKADGQ